MTMGGDQEMIACHTGDATQAEADLAPIRAFGNPIADGISRKPYVEQQSLLDATQPKGLHNYWKSEFLPGLSDELLETYRQQGASIASPLSQAIIFQLSGALADRDSGATSAKYPERWLFGTSRSSLASSSRRAASGIPGLVPT
jgi:hypothetical protein